MKHVMRAVVLCGLAVVLAVGVTGCKTGTKEAKETPKLPFEVGKAIDAKGDYQAAIAEYQKEISDYPDSPLKPYAAFNIAKCYEKLGMKDEALKQYDKVMADYKDSEVAGWAKEDKKFLEEHPDLVLPKPKPAPAVEEPAPAPKEEAAPAPAAEEKKPEATEKK